MRGGATTARLFALLRPAGGGPVVLRLGGNSGDCSYWHPKSGRMPPWVCVPVGPSLLRGFATLVRAAGLHSIVALNLAARRPLLAAAWANAVVHALPPGSVDAFELGNEPDLYHVFPWYHVGRRPVYSRPRAYDSAGYLRDVHAFAPVLRKHVRGIRLAGPGEEGVEWIPDLRAFLGSAPSLRVVTQHRYPLHQCGTRRSSPYFPTIPRLLAERATQGLARELAPIIRGAHRAGRPLLVTETGSVACGGGGVANTFAASLWAPDALFELAAAGADGVDLHERPGQANVPFEIDEHGLRARPLLYGLLLFVRALGPGARIVPVTVRTRARIKVWAVRSADGALRFVLLNKGARPVAVTLRVASLAQVEVERLRAPSARARGGVTLAGQRLGRDGRWHGARRAEPIEAAGGRVTVDVPGASGALVLAGTG